MIFNPCSFYLANSPTSITILSQVTVTVYVGFPVQKTLEEFDFKRLKHVEEAYIHELASCDFIRNRQNVLML
ncbi:MAG: ATP-binding protein, partial [bacterium]